MSKTERLKKFENELIRRFKIKPNENYSVKTELNEWKVHFECCDVERKIFNNK